MLRRVMLLLIIALLVACSEPTSPPVPTVRFAPNWYTPIPGLDSLERKTP